MFESGHPTSLELASLLDGGEGDILGRGTAVRSHVAECNTCLAHLLTAGDVVASEPGTVGLPEVPGSRVPAQALEAMSQPRPSGVGQSEMWRLTWDELTVLAVVTMAGDTTATVVPVADAAEADEAAQIVPSDDSPLGATFAVWPAEKVLVSLAAFDTYLGHVLAELSTLTEVVRPSVAAELRSIGERSVAWMPTATEEDTAAPKPSVVVALEERGLGFDELADAVGDEPALELWRDGRPPSPDEMKVLVERLGVLAEAIATQRTAPVPVLKLVCSPDYKDAVRRAASRRGTSEADVRVGLVETILSPAARTTGARRDTELLKRWRGLIDHELTR